MSVNAKFSWVELAEEALLEHKIADLGLQISATDLESQIQELYANLAQKNIPFRPACYLADEWFVLEGKTAIGIPFYLAHPRLKKIEEKIMLEAEGADPKEFIKLLRHEAGHAVFYAYRFNKNPLVKKTFGSSPEEIPTSYRPKPYSKSYVRHLDNWYAQAEPDEDFAETFAVWLTPDSDWQKNYRGWPALQKLQVMDRLMAEIMEKKPWVEAAEKAFYASTLRLKLKTYYARKQKYFAQDYPDFYDRDLNKIFTLEKPASGAVSAREFMKRHQKNIVQKVSHWTREKKFIVNNLYKKLLERCTELSMYLKQEESETLMELSSFLASLISNYLYTGKFKPTV